MSSRAGNTKKTETEIEDCRSKGKWQKVTELAEEIKTTHGKHLIKFISVMEYYFIC